jgi:DNA-binding HxlR family transcriptional regulator
VTSAARAPYNCPVELALDQLGGKWKAVLLAHLKQGALRYSQLRRLVPKLSDKILTQRLRELEASGLVARRRDPRSRQVEYSLSPRGRSLGPVLQSLYDWGQRVAGETGVVIQDPRRVAPGRTTGRRPGSSAPR